MKPNFYIEELEVVEDDIDDLNHVNNLKYMIWTQEVSKNHWENAASKSHQEKYGWVVLNFTISFLSPAFLGETLCLKTWILDHKGAKSHRQVEIIRKSDQKLLAKAKILWCLIDKANQRPQPIRQEILTPFFS